MSATRSSRRRALSNSPLAVKRRARKILRHLAAGYPDAHCELHHRNPFELLVATVLSAQTTDVAVNRCTNALFAAYPDAQALAQAEAERVEDLVRTTGFYRSKARAIIGLAGVLVREFDGQVPGRLEDLVTLPGVGRKTAFVVLGNAFGTPGLTVDTHFGRLARRFGWTASKDPVAVEREVAQLFERRDLTDLTDLSHHVIFHGRRVCHAKKPACGACLIADLCPAYGAGETVPAKAAKIVKPATPAQLDAAARGVPVPQPPHSIPGDLDLGGDA